MSTVSGFPRDLLVEGACAHIVRWLDRHGAPGEQARAQALRTANIAALRRGAVDAPIAFAPRTLREPGALPPICQLFDLNVLEDALAEADINLRGLRRR